MTPVIRNGPSVYQTVYNVLCERLRRALSDGMRRAPGDAEGIDSVLLRLSGALYALLMTHPIDRRGRCRSCRRLGTVLRLRRGRCGVHREASYWLRQPEKFLRARLVDEWGLADLPPPAAPDRESTTGPTDPDSTGVLPTTAAEPADPPRSR